MTASDSRPWASATFVGERHRIEGEADGAFLKGLETAELVLGGHIVADVSVARVKGSTVVLDVLTIEQL